MANKPNETKPVVTEETTPLEGQETMPIPEPETISIPGLDLSDPQMQALFQAVLKQVETNLAQKEAEKVDPNEARLKRLQESEAAKAKEETTVKLFLDGDKYKDDVYVAYNGRAYLIKRGVSVTVPKGVANVLRDAERQAAAASKHTKGLQQQYEDRTREIG